MPIGQHFTPAPLSRWLTERALVGMEHPEDRLRVVDPACGQGVFLDAAAATWGARPGLSLLGIELDPVAAAVARGGAGPSRAIVEGDALALAGAAPLEDGSADLVLLNPPYVGEKGHRGLFEGVARLGPRWSERRVARMDYLYFFLHLGLDLLRPGGRMAALTTAYWPSATSARVLREDLGRRARILGWVGFEGDPIFPGATGQHNLALLIERVASPDAPAPFNWERARMGPGGRVEVVHVARDVAPLPADAPWQPFVEAARSRQVLRESRGWAALGDVAADRQGVVSGCDRIGPRAARALGQPGRLGEPVFVLTGQEVVERGWDRDPEIAPLLEPLLRGSEIGRLDVRRRRAPLGAPEGLATGSPEGSPEGLVMLYLTRSGPEPPAAILAHLAPFRALLESRREVATGVIPWWALHWPRRLEEMRRPKLVTARRASGVRFCLDLAGHVVSSDCTFLLPLDDDPELLEILWGTLHLEAVERVIRASGKVKGDLMEFYSEPLRRLPVPLAREVGRWRSLVPEMLKAALREAGEGPSGAGS